MELDAFKICPQVDTPLIDGVSFTSLYFMTAAEGTLGDFYRYITDSTSPSPDPGQIPLDPEPPHKISSYFRTAVLE